MSHPSRWPVRVKRGNFKVTICTGDRKKNGRIYREFKLLILFESDGFYACPSVRSAVTLASASPAVAARMDIWPEQI